MLHLCAVFRMRRPHAGFFATVPVVFGNRVRRLLAVCKTLASNSDRACNRLSIVQLATGPKRSMGHVRGGEKGNFLIRAGRCPMVYGSRVSLILSIPAQGVSLGSPRVGTIHCKRLRRMRRRIQHILANSLSIAAHLSMNYLAMASRAIGAPKNRRMRYR